jgi:hypothetical protein
LLAGGTAGIAAAVASIADGKRVAIIRRTNPFGSSEGYDAPASSLRASDALLATLLDRGDHNRRPLADERHQPAAFTRGYNSGDIAEFLRLEAA